MNNRSGGNSQSTPISTVIFDYGGVLSSPLAPALRTLEQRQGFSPGSLDELLFGGQHLNPDDPDHTGGDPIDGRETPGNRLHALWHQLECGAIDFEVFLNALSDRAPSVIGRSLTTMDFLLSLAELEIGTHWTMVHYIRELRTSGFQIGLLTNNVSAFGDHWKATVPLAELFDVIVDSSDVGMRKPDPAIYLLICERLGVAPEACVFIDDNHDNVVAAAELGMHTVRMRLDPRIAEQEMRTLLLQHA